MKSNKMLPQYSNKQNKNQYKLLNNGVGHMGKLHEKLHKLYNTSLSQEDVDLKLNMTNDLGGCISIHSPSS